MPFLVTIAASVLLALLRRGRFEQLAQLQFRQPWLVGAGALLWLATGPLPLQQWLQLAEVAPLLLLLAHALLLLFVAQNSQTPWLWLVGLGLLANTVVMAANGGQMPVDPALIRAIGAEEETHLLQQQGLWLHIRTITSETRLPFLGDVLLLGHPFPWPRIVSVGDLLVAAGAFLIIQAAMLKPADAAPKPTDPEGEKPVESIRGAK